MNKKVIFGMLGVAVIAILGLLALKFLKPKHEEQAITASVSCSDPEVIKKVRADLANDIQKQVGLNIQTTILDNHNSYNEEALNTIFKVMKVKAANSRVQDQQSSSGTLTCATTIAVVLPTHVYTEADEYQTLEPDGCEEDCGSTRYAQRAADANLEFDGSRVTQASLTYVLQQDTEGKLLVQIENFDPIKTFVTNAIVNAMDLPNAEQRNIQSQANNQRDEEQSQEKRNLVTQAMDIRLKEVTNDYEKVNNQLNNIWQKAGSATTQLILDEQRDWLKKRDIDCQIESEKNPENGNDTQKQSYELQRYTWTNDMVAKDKEIRRIICVNRITKERIPELTDRIAELQQSQKAAPAPATP